jgi:hypothetical protein
MAIRPDLNRVLSVVMAGLDPAIHVLPHETRG